MQLWFFCHSGFQTFGNFEEKTYTKLPNALNAIRNGRCSIAAVGLISKTSPMIPFLLNSTSAPNGCESD